MADRSVRAEGTPECRRAREALLAGDHRAARELAAEVLQDGQAPAEAKAEAARIERATRVDKAPIIAGIVMLLVLAALFAWALSTRPS